MTSTDRPVARRRATAAPDEAAGLSPIDAPTPTRVKPTSAGAARVKKKVTYAQLNVRLTSDEWAQFEAIQEHDGLGQVEAVRQIITEAIAARGL